MVWKLPVYHSILAMLTNPMYAGAYAFGKTEVRTRIIDGRVRHAVLLEIFTTEGVGTEVVRTASASKRRGVSQLRHKAGS